MTQAEAEKREHDEMIKRKSNYSVINSIPSSIKNYNKNSKIIKNNDKNAKLQIYSDLFSEASFNIKEELSNELNDSLLNLKNVPWSQSGFRPSGILDGIYKSLNLTNQAKSITEEMRKIVDLAQTSKNITLNEEISKKIIDSKYNNAWNSYETISGNTKTKTFFTFYHTTGNRYNFAMIDIVEEKKDYFFGLITKDWVIKNIDIKVGMNSTISLTK